MVRNIKYFNGFSLKNEEVLFENYIDTNTYTVAGFSYGAQKALEHVYCSKHRVDRLILLSPAFFQTQKKSFIRTQLHYFDKDKSAYVKQFLSNIAFPSSCTLDKYLDTSKKEELEELLTYIWDNKKIETILDRGTTIEVFLGMEDKILDSSEALIFFKKSCTTYHIKNSGHLLEA